MRDPKEQLHPAVLGGLVRAGATILAAAVLSGCAGYIAPTAATVIWEDAAGSDAAFEADCARCRSHVMFESLAQNFEDPVLGSSGAERYARARAWGRAALRACLVDAGYAVRIAPAAQAPAPEKMCGIEGVIYPL